MSAGFQSRLRGMKCSSCLIPSLYLDAITTALLADTCIAEKNLLYAFVQNSVCPALSPTWAAGSMLLVVGNVSLKPLVPLEPSLQLPRALFPLPPAPAPEHKRMKEGWSGALRASYLIKSRRKHQQIKISDLPYSANI